MVEVYRECRASKANNVDRPRGSYEPRFAFRRQFVAASNPPLGRQLEERGTRLQEGLSVWSPTAYGAWSDWSFIRLGLSCIINHAFSSEQGSHQPPLRGHPRRRSAFSSFISNIFRPRRCAEDRLHNVLAKRDAHLGS